MTPISYSNQDVYHLALVLKRIILNGKKDKFEAVIYFLIEKY